ncbi:hypothetical protein GCM10022214_61910 [Actinomadura miaoliensis]|uniref:DUF397 domain-containing protein n=1 Tax=Actinomadura miaoliensis TaxID=430685 RepID=A0ABP7WMA2_9ACTN
MPPGVGLPRSDAARRRTRQVIELQPWQQFPLDNRGSWIAAIPESSPMCHDAAFLPDVDGRAVLNCNDARLVAVPSRRTRRLADNRPDVMALRPTSLLASGSLHVPACRDGERRPGGDVPGGNPAPRNSVDIGGFCNGMSGEGVVDRVRPRSF